MPKTLQDNIETLIEDYRLNIAKALGYDPQAPPVLIDDKQAAQVLGVSANTLSVWRSLGRYGIPFVKSGRLVRYRVDDLAKFLALRTVTHTGKIV
ncbi:helix-turn-helix domain-containing protein [Pseudomonas putida]|uniref:Helix-turn-helix domain-containing protein n=2 Tax=Pseudomonas putida TaxID=303 RepID=A0A2Z4RTM6_PSEPU|nr:helix-turn-helix domain-containing protein [Pseudomonas putida]